MNRLILFLTITCLCFCSVSKLQTTYGDSTKVSEFYANGKLKIEGVKYKNFRHGKWKAYDDKGNLTKVIIYSFGKIVKERDVAQFIK
tara:strand:- start:527 stop:787 length:261 start_codon:yes stop_codon:yes gene_type:complete